MLLCYVVSAAFIVLLENLLCISKVHFPLPSSRALECSCWELRAIYGRTLYDYMKN